MAIGSIRIPFDKESYLIYKELSNLFNDQRCINSYKKILKLLNTEHNVCKDCGNPIIYNESKINVSKRKNDIIIRFVGRSFLSKKTTGDNLKVCEACISNKFPEWKTKNTKRIFNQMNPITKYAFGISDEIYQSKRNEFIVVSKENFIKKYGENDGTIRWEKYKEKQSKTNTFEYKNEKYGMTKEEFDLYNKSRAVTLNNMINKYGEDLGTKKYLSYIDKQLSKSPMGKSKPAQEFFKLLDKELNKAGINTDNSMYSDKNKEKHLLIKDIRKNYFLDYYLPDHKIAVEFYGDFWHMNPKQYESEDLQPYSKNKAKDIWEYDKNRINDIYKHYKIQTFVVWESKCAVTITDLVDKIKNHILIKELNDNEFTRL